MSNGECVDSLYYSQRTPLQWNNFRIIYGNYRIVVRFRVVVTSKILGMIGLRDSRLDRLKLMNDLSKEGYTYQQISTKLNEMGLRKIRTDTPYTKKDVSMGLMKYRRRMERYNKPIIESVKEELVLIPLYIRDKNHQNLSS